MSLPANTLDDLLAIPGFTACRDERCKIVQLHRQHPVEGVGGVGGGRPIHQRYDKCPECQTPVVVTKTRRKRRGSSMRETISAKCPNCGWAHTNALKSIQRTNTDA